MNGIHPFAIDKSRAVLYEGIALGKIQDWYRLQGKVVEVRYNEANGLEAKRGFDLIDMFGKTYEVKTDNIALTTGRTFISESLRHKSTADFVVYLIPPGAYIIPRELLLSLATSGSANVGDGGREHGDFLPLDTLKQYADLV